MTASTAIQRTSRPGSRPHNFHRPEELEAEAAAAGLAVREVVGVEGLAGWLWPLAERWNDPDHRETILFSARAVESEPSLLGLSPHLVAVAESPA